MATNSVLIKQQVEKEKRTLKSHQRLSKVRLDQHVSEQKAVNASLARLSKLEKTLVVTLANEKRKGIVHPPASFLGWRLTRRGDRFIFGCGDVTVGVNQLKSFIRLEEAINKNFHLSGRIIAHKAAFEAARVIVGGNGNIPTTGLSVVNFHITSAGYRQYSFGCGSVTANFEEIYTFYRIHSHAKTHNSPAGSNVRRGRILGMAKKLLKILEK